MFVSGGGVWTEDVVSDGGIYLIVPRSVVACGAGVAGADCPGVAGGTGCAEGVDIGAAGLGLSGGVAIGAGVDTGVGVGVEV